MSSREKPFEMNESGLTLDAIEAQNVVGEIRYLIDNESDWIDGRSRILFGVIKTALRDLRERSATDDEKSIPDNGFPEITPGSTILIRPGRIQDLADHWGKMHTLYERLGDDVSNVYLSYASEAIKQPGQVESNYQLKLELERNE